MFPLIPCCSSGLIDTQAQEVVMRGEELNHIPAAPEPALGTGSCSTWAVSSMGQRGKAKYLGTFSDYIKLFNPNYCNLWDPKKLQCLFLNSILQMSGWDLTTQYFPTWLTVASNR